MLHALPPPPEDQGRASLLYIATCSSNPSPLSFSHSFCFVILESFSSFCFLLLLSPPFLVRVSPSLLRPLRYCSGKKGGEPPAFAFSALSLSLFLALSVNVCLSSSPVFLPLPSFLATAFGLAERRPPKKRPGGKRSDFGRSAL